MNKPYRRFLGSTLVRDEDRYAMPLSEVRAGQELTPDGGHTCLVEGDVYVVRVDNGGAYVNCRYGKHYLKNQSDGEGTLIGLAPADEAFDGEELFVSASA